jgi:hypothetical protein
VSGLRERQKRTADPVLKDTVAARAAILRAVGAVRVGRVPEDPDVVRSIAEEVGDAADEPFTAVKQSEATVTPLKRLGA